MRNKLLIIEGATDEEGEEVDGLKRGRKVRVVGLDFPSSSTMLAAAAEAQQESRWQGAEFAASMRAAKATGGRGRGSGIRGADGGGRVGGEGRRSSGARPLAPARPAGAHALAGSIIQKPKKCFLKVR